MSTSTEAPVRVLVVDDEDGIRRVLSQLLRRMGYTADTAGSGEEAIALFDAQTEYGLVITDLRMPDGELSGLNLLRHIKATRPACQVIVMTAFGTVETALEAIREGAYDFITKPLKLREVQPVFERAVDVYRLVCENLYLREQLEDSRGFDTIIGRSDAMQRVFHMVQRVAQSPATVLVTGESGTGKELIARALHNHSARADGPFVAVNCGAIPEQLMESELFGHKRGAFTGAVADHKGMFEAASGGTIFLDEIGELPLAMQVKLLRVLNDHRVKPVGAARDIPIDVRVVAATNRDLQAMTEEGTFRQDLYYRLAVIPLELPPLREREGDVRLLLEHYVDIYKKRLVSEVQGIRADAMRLLLNYSYPGNVRELQNIVERAVTLEQEEFITPSVLPMSVQEEPFERTTEVLEIPEEGIDLESMVKTLQRSLVLKALERTGGVKKEAADLLGLSYRQMRYLTDKLEID